MITIAPKGTKDIMPDESHKWQAIEEIFRSICSRYGFKEIRTPAFEYTKLFQRGVGDTTDIVQKEMYTFEDMGHRSITLKPEGTSPAARAFIEHKAYAGVQPTKYYYLTPCFRYEKPQSGRYREFHQFGIETFGTPSMLADAEVICLANDLLCELGITDVKLLINSVGCPECREKHREALKKFLSGQYDNLCNTCKDRYDRNPMRILDCKSDSCKEIVKDAPLMIDYLCEDCAKAFEEVKENLDAFEIPYTVDPSIVRGLDYYTKTAFEFVTEDIGAQSTICGGGRYDHLIEEVGGPPIPGVGFGLGIERLLLLLESKGIEFSEPDRADVFIITMGETAKKYGINILREFRKEGIKAEMDTLERNVKGQFKYANRINAENVIVIGDDELEKGLLQFKNMDTSKQVEMKKDDIKEELLKKYND